MLKVTYWRASKPNEEPSILVDAEMPYGPRSLHAFVALVCKQEDIPNDEFMIVSKAEYVITSQAANP
jgi:hypothetical protein